MPIELKRRYRGLKRLLRIRGIKPLFTSYFTLIKARPWLITITLLTIVLAHMAYVAEATGSLSVTYTINYVNYYTSSGVKSYINYGINLINENSSAINVVVGFRLPPYSSILYASSGYLMSGDEVYWDVKINPFETVSLNVEFQNPLVNGYVINFKYLINGSTTPSQVINGSPGVKLIMLINASNLLGLPLTYNAYIPLQNGINYYYSTPPTGLVSIGTGEYTYWSGELPRNGSIGLNVTFIIANSGNWSAINLGSLTFTSSIDLYYYLNYLKLTIGQLNNTLAEFSNIPYVRPISSNATILLNDLYQLSYLLNTTATLYRQSAYYMNSTRVIESLLLLQVYEVNYALKAEYGVLSKLNYTIPMVSYSLKQIMSNLTQLNNEIINLQYEVISDVVYAYGEIKQYNVTLMELIPILNATNTTLAGYYQYLGYVQGNLTKLYNEVNSLNINSEVKASILGELGKLIKDVDAMRATVLRLEGYVSGAEMGVLMASRQLSELAYQLNTRGTAIVIALTNISNTLVRTNQSVYSLYIALNYLGNVLNSTTSTLNTTLSRLNMALAVPTSLYGNLTNITNGLIQTSSQLQNASAKLMSMYFNLTGQYLLFSLAINQSIEYQKVNLINELDTYETYYEVAKSTYNQYLSNLIINSSSSYTVDIVVEQTSEVNLPIILNIKYISSVLSNITSINTDAGGGGGSIRGISRGAYGLLIVVLALTLGLILNKRKYIINNIFN
ncbi:hypothetical protein [Caldivirga sp.]|uniref:hypothetical protein n=1 Tax=Caldivirga sp. TaxID=2080243 RepID=UPI003D0D24F9